MKLLIKNGTVVNGNESFIADVLIDDHIIKSIKKNISPEKDMEVIDASGKYVIPGIIDAHVHFFMKVGTQERTIDDFYTGSVSAACGGVTTIIDYVEPEDDQMPLDALDIRKKKAEGNSCVDYSFHYVIRQWDEKFLGQLQNVIQSGITSFKVFTAYDSMKLTYREITEVLAWSKEKKVLITVHAEDDQIINNKIMDLKNYNRIQPSLHGKSRPVQSEVSAVQKVLECASKTQAPVYFVHISTADAAKLIRQAQKRGQEVYAETCPHYFILNEEIYQKSKQPQLYIMCPPLREEKQRSDLYNTLEEDVFSVIATDHCAFSFEQKMRSDTFYETLAGIPGVETLLPLTYSKGVVKGKFDMEKLVKYLSYNPAKIFGLYPQKGVIMEGSDADIVIFNPNKELILRGDRLHSAANYTPFEGIKVSGYPETTILRGKIIYNNGKFLGKKGEGRFVAGRVTL